ncbi:unnamed protein product [Clonostachys rosea f. rosea IK726]|uniref:Major facilitator superfamily (MFS) profile domain-containing protein n=2 Tax=Bionectria ochroleuca TaxID=29856 RepID=A0A0B7KKI8_BIOOC|nr:unnamed protein product [Clonostachys rosea f. rosea IK726]
MTRSTENRQLEDVRHSQQQSSSQPNNLDPTNTINVAAVEEGQSSVEPPPDGGYGWVCAGAASVINAHSWGFNSAYAVFLAHYLSNDIFPGATPRDYAFVGGISLTFLLLVSPIATIAVREIGIRPTMFCGVVCETASLLCASLASKVWHLFLTQGVLFGMGLGLLFIPTAAVVPQWFAKKRSLASGIAVSGAGLGGAVYSLAAAAIIRNLSLEYAFRILGILAFVINTTCVILIKDRNKAIGSDQEAFKISLFKRGEYLLLIGFSAFTMLGYFVLVFSLANYASEMGLSPSQGALIPALFNIGQAIGRPIVGYFSDTVGRMNMAASTALLSAILVFAAWIPSKANGPLIFFAISGGLAAGSFWATIAPLMAEVVGLQGVPSGLNLMWLSLILPSTFSEPIALEIFNGTGSYLGTQVFVGVVYFAAAVCMILLRGWKICQVEVGARNLVHTEGTGQDGSITRNRRDPPRSGVSLRACLKWANV